MSVIRVLHVDDDPSFVDLTATFLEREDERLEVVTETTAADGIDRLGAEDAIDCVVSDYDMPGMDGLDFLQAVREEHDELPFVLFTGKGSEEIAGEAIAAGVTDYIQKGGTGQYTVLANRIVNAVGQYRTARTAERTERRLQELAEKSNDVLWVFSADWNELLFVNSAVEDLYGVSVETLRDRPRSFLDAIHPDDRERTRRAMERLSAGQPAEIEYRVNEASEYRRWAWVQADPVFDHDGDVDRIVGFTRDVTERKRRERALETFTDVAVDLDSYETVERICERCIEASQNILSFDLSVIDEERDGYLHKVAISADIPATNTTTMSTDEGIAGKTYRTGESMLVDDLEASPDAKPQGPYRSVISVPVGDHGVFQAVSEERAAFDETDRELAELLVSHTASALDRLERERQLHHQNERLEEFTRIVSHDLRNPLNVIDGNLELAREECDSDHLAEAAAGLARVERIVEDTLTLAREGRIVDEMEPVDLESLAGNCWRTVETESATLEVSTDAEIGADPERLRHVFENLFGNAVEHGGSDVTVRVGECENGFYVEDDGAGVPEGQREALFQSGHAANGGSGFGLAIVDRIVQAHGWEVDVSEGRDGGVRFEFSDA